jgi:hypothetical protein
VSNFSFASESSVNRSTEVEEETFKGSFFGLDAASRGSGLCRTGGIDSFQNYLSRNLKVASLAERVRGYSSDEIRCGKSRFRSVGFLRNIQYL